MNSGRLTIEPLQSILEAREQRSFLKNQIALKALPCVSLSLNVPGFPKSNSNVKAFFNLVLHDLKYHLKAHLIDIHTKESHERVDAAGEFFIVPVSKGTKSMANLKLICEDFESKHPLGRFIDVDLNDEQGNTVSSGKSKLCFFCNEKPAIECRRENAHDQEELRQFMFSKMAGYCSQQREAVLVKQLSSLALKALLYEISLTPKPGLVDKFSNGSHADMNYQTFIDSSVAISSMFEEMVRTGFSFQDKDLTKALPVIRNIGLRMEDAMFETTQNINTQKGIVFLMGLSLFACGRLFSQNESFEIEQFREVIKEICKNLVKNELDDVARTEKSHGEVIYRKHGFSGARGEAESGFRTVFEFGLPQLTGVEELINELQKPLNLPESGQALKGTLKSSFIFNDFPFRGRGEEVENKRTPTSHIDLSNETMIKCFLAIASNNTDTNILYRRGPEVLSIFQGFCKNTLEDYNESNYSAVIDFCKAENISPGGSADLLAISIFVWLVGRM